MKGMPAVAGRLDRKDPVAIGPTSEPGRWFGAYLLNRRASTHYAVRGLMMPFPARPTRAPALDAGEIDERSAEDQIASDWSDLVEHCLAVHALIDEHGSPAMRRLIDLLLFEIGGEIGGQVEEDRDLN